MHSGIAHIRVSELVLALLFALLLVAPMLDASFSGHWSYADELATIVLCAWALLSRSPAKRDKGMRGALVCLTAFCLLGLAGNALYGYQSSPFAVAVDLFTCVKLFVAYLAARIALDSRARCLSMFLWMGKAFILCALFGLLLHVTGVVQLGQGREMFGIPCYSFLFSHPTNLVAYCVGVAALLFAEGRVKPLWILCVIALLIASQRAKAFGMAFVLIFFYLYGVVRKNDEKPSVLLFFPLAIGVAFIGVDAFQSYFMDETSARTLLLVDGLSIAASSFSLGSGFATFGSYMSGEYYSPLYYAYGLDTVWGLYPSNPTFVSDQFWPAVIAQAGVLGAAALVAAGAVIWGVIRRDAGKARLRFMAYATIPIYLLILSTADASFFNFYGPFYALVLGAVTNGALTPSGQPLQTTRQDMRRRLK